MDRAEPRARVVLDIDAGADPPTGSLRRENGGAQEFTGWLELARMLEQLRQAARVPARPENALDASPSALTDSSDPTAMS